MICCSYSISRQCVSLFYFTIIDRSYRAAALRTVRRILLKRRQDQRDPAGTNISAENNNAARRPPPQLIFKTSMNFYTHRIHARQRHFHLNEAFFEIRGTFPDENIPEPLFYMVLGYLCHSLV